MMKYLAMALLAAGSVASVGTASAATLVGTTVTGQLEAGLRATVTQQFTSPAVVGAGTEFTGELFQSDFGGQAFTFALDLSQNNIVINIGSPTGPFANIGSTVPLAVIRLTSATGVFPAITGASAVFPSQPNRVFDPVPQFSYTSSASEITLNFGNLVAGERLTVAFAAVPEPASWAMMIGGFGLAGAAMRRRTRVRARVQAFA